MTYLVTADFTGTLPNAIVPPLVLMVDTTAVKFKPNVRKTPAELAVRVTVCEVPIGDTAAVKPALVAPAGTNTLAGTTTLELLLDRLTVSPPVGAGALSEAVHASLAKPLAVALEQESELKAAAVVDVLAPVPLRLMPTQFPADELVERASVPVTLPAAPGANRTVSVADVPGLTFAGRVKPETENPLPCVETE